MKTRFFFDFMVMQFKNMRGRHWWLSLLVWFILAFPAAARELRVAIEEGVSQVKIGSSTNATVTDGTGRVLGQLAGMNGFAAQLKNGMVALDRWQAGEIKIQPTGEGYVYIGDRWYRGSIRIVSTGKALTAVNHVDLDNYLYSVLGAEMDASWPQEALKAQAVAARSYALYEQINNFNGISDVGDTQGWQVYKGVETESPGTYAAVNATKGLFMAYNNQVILAAFHSCSGGRTENVEDVWVDPLPYLRGVQDYDEGAPGCRWSQTLSREDLSRKIPGVGNVIAFVPEKTIEKTGRIIKMKVIGDAGTKVFDGEELRQKLGLSSNLFKVIPQGGTSDKALEKTPPSAFMFQGAGFGHGLGLSQWGAYNLARQGWNYQAILTHYYQGAILAKMQ